MFSLFLALSLLFRRTSASQIGSIVFVNVSATKTSILQDPEAARLASNLNGRFVKIVDQTINTCNNHSKWIIQSLNTASINKKQKFNVLHLSIFPTFKTYGVGNAIQFHYISPSADVEEYKLWTEPRGRKKHLFILKGLEFMKPVFESQVVYVNPFQCLHTLRFISEPQLISRTESRSASADALLSLYLLDLD